MSMLVSGARFPSAAVQGVGVPGGGLAGSPGLSGTMVRSIVAPREWLETSAT